MYLTGRGREPPRKYVKVKPLLKTVGATEQLNKRPAEESTIARPPALMVAFSLQKFPS